MSTVSKGFESYLHTPLTHRLQQALAAMRDGRPVILMDDDSRENEADLIVAAERVTIASMAMMIRECSGIVCLCMEEEALRELELPAMVQHNESANGTAFTISVDARDGITTGVSAADRVATVKAAIAPGASARDLVRPGHIFPLCANPKGVLGRRGHTEGSVDLARLAGLRPAALLCELMNPDGTMMRGQQVDDFAAKHRYPMTTIEDLVHFRTSKLGARKHAAVQQTPEIALPGAPRPALHLG